MYNFTYYRADTLYSGPFRVIALILKGNELCSFIYSKNIEYLYPGKNLKTLLFVKSLITDTLGLLDLSFLIMTD